MGLRRCKEKQEEEVKIKKRHRKDELCYGDAFETPWGRSCSSPNHSSVCLKAVVPRLVCDCFPHAPRLSSAWRQGDPFSLLRRCNRKIPTVTCGVSLASIYFFFVSLSLRLS